MKMFEFRMKIEKLKIEIKEKLIFKNQTENVCYLCLVC